MSIVILMSKTSSEDTSAFLAHLHAAKLGDLLLQEHTHKSEIRAKSLDAHVIHLRVDILSTRFEVNAKSINFSLLKLTKMFPPIAHKVKCAFVVHRTSACWQNVFTSMVSFYSKEDLRCVVTIK